MLSTASFEVLAQDIVQSPSLLTKLDAGTEIYVPYPPTGTWEETLTACRLLSETGCRPVPHLPARRVRDLNELVEWVESLESLGVRSVLLIAGDAIDDGVCFKDSLEVLQTRILATHGIDCVGVAVYPDGHPFITTQDLEVAFDRKLEIAARDGFAIEAVTQFGFDAEPLHTWLAASHGSGLQIPVSIGVAGPTQMKTLLRYATKCGVRHSVKGLLAKPSVLRTLGQWDPLQVLSPLAEWTSAGMDIRVKNAHVFTFGGLERVLQWREQLLQTCDEVG